MSRLPPVLAGILRWFGPRLRSPAAPAVALIASAAVAFALANSPLAGAYLAVRDAPVRVGVGSLALEKPLLLWINDGLMAVFFLVVGLEVKRELLTGHLSSVRRATLPVLAAVGGMVVPALLYVAIAGRAGPSGWGVPMATDIAFALGVLALLRSRVPAALVVFLTAFAVADDVGAVLVITLFYAHGVSAGALAVSAALLGAQVALNRLGVRRVAPYLALGVPMWVAVLKSGVHPTVAGLLTALAIPHRGAEGAASPLVDLEHRLAPAVAWGILPVFALANAGVALGEGVSPLDPVGLGVAVGLVLGKLAGVGGVSWLAVRLGLAEAPPGVGALHLAGLGLLGGIGFTMAIFIANLAFADPLQAETAKAGVLLGSVVAAAAGAAVLLWAARRGGSGAGDERAGGAG